MIAIKLTNLVTHSQENKEKVMQFLPQILSATEKEKFYSKIMFYN